VTSPPREATPAGIPRSATVVEALSRVMEDVRAVGKDSLNVEQRYRFRGVDAVVNAVGPSLREHGVVVVPVRVEASYRDVLTSRGKPSRECTVKASYRLYGPQGDYLEAEVPGESMDFGDKGAAKAMSVAYRILLLQTLCIPTGDVDPDSTSYERETEPTPETPVSLRIRIKRLADSRGKKPDEVADEFASWSMGAAIGDADVETLANFINAITEGTVLK
jgi:ERF superfamily